MSRFARTFWGRSPVRKGLLIGAIAGALIAPVALLALPCVGLFVLLPPVFLGEQVFRFGSSDLITDAGIQRPVTLFALGALTYGPIGAFAGFLIGALVERYPRRRRPRRGSPRCAQCGYNLTGNVSGRCPECGTSILPQGSVSRRPPE